MTLTRCLAKLCPLMNELKQAYLPNKHNKPAKFFLTFADVSAAVLRRDVKPFKLSH